VIAETAAAVAPVAPVEAPAPEAKKADSGGKYWRQMDFCNPDKLNEYSFLVVGAGSVGSWATLALTKMGAQHVSVWDKDIISEHNASVQIYSAREVGERKVKALVDWVGKLTDVGVVGRLQHLDKDSTPVLDPNTILVMAVDSMEARRYLWELAKACPEIKLVIDPRMGGEAMRMYAVNPRDPQHEAFYEENLDYVGETLPCTGQAIIYTSMFAASFVSSIVSSFVNGAPFRNEIMFHTRSFKIIQGEAA
jgi:hypothetical protein